MFQLSVIFQLYCLYTKIYSLVGLMDFKQGLNRTKNTPIALKAKLCIKFMAIISSFISRLSSGQVQRHIVIWGDNSIPYDKRNSPQAYA